jgi:MFS family permease
MGVDQKQAELSQAPPSILRNRNFRLLWIGESISLFGGTVGSFAFTLVAAAVLHATAGQMGLIIALGRIPSFALGLFAGALVDRLPRRLMLIAIDLSLALIVSSVPLLYALDLLNIYWLYANSIVFGAVHTFAGPAWSAFLPSVVPKDRLVDANSKMMLSFSSSGVVGPAIAPVLVELIRAPATMLVDAVSFLVSAAILVRIKVDEVIERDKQKLERLIPRIAAGLRIAFLDRMQRALTAPRAILDLVDAMAFAIYVLYVLRTVGLSTFLLGVTYACGAIGFTAGSFFAARIERRLGAGRTALFGLILVGISPFTMILANDGNPTYLNVVYLSLPGLIGGFGGMVQHVMLLSLRQAITPNEALGRVHGSVSVLRGLMGIAGAALGGWLGEAIGLRATIAVVAVSYTIPVWYSLLSPLPRASTRDDVDAEVSVPV